MHNLLLINMCMNISHEGINLIKNFEGFRPLAYYCPAGLLTIGWGHTIQPTEKLNGILLDKNSKVSLQQAILLLQKDITNAEHVIFRNVKAPLIQGQFDALVSFVFNLGEKNFMRSTLLKKLNDGDYEGAANQFPRWVYVNKKALVGLMNRRAAEMRLWHGIEAEKAA